MSNRAVVCVATTPAYQKGMRRLRYAEFTDASITRDTVPEGCPSHSERPYAFKAYMLKQVSETQDGRFDTLLWCDASMFPVQDMTPLWELIESQGYWFSKCGWSNYEWTADSAYPDLFPELDWEIDHAAIMNEARSINETIPHVVATCFGLSMRHEIGRKFLAEYYRLASETKAFCGPWTNANSSDRPAQVDPHRYAPCGPSDVRGHRHDQTAASVIVWRLGMKLTDPPEIFSYPPQGWDRNNPTVGLDQRTILLADGSY